MPTTTAKMNNRPIDQWDFHQVTPEQEAEAERLSGFLELEPIPEDEFQQQLARAGFIKEHKDGR